jgi:arginine exporter protein ArgO
MISDREEKRRYLMDIIAGLSLQQILMIGLGIVVVGFIIKKLFKLALIIGVIMVLYYYGLPILQNVLHK